MFTLCFFISVDINYINKNLFKVSNAFRKIYIISFFFTSSRTHYIKMCICIKFTYPEHIEEVCYRLRRQNKLAITVHFSVGYSKNYNGGIRKTHTLNRPTNLTMDIYHICTYFLHQQYTVEPIRSINISLTNLLQEGEEQISLFDNVTKREQEMKLTKVMDEIRTKFGKNSILRGISYTHSATARHRNTLIGGHRS